jgi:hypothetical protein
LHYEALNQLVLASPHLIASLELMFHKVHELKHFNIVAQFRILVCKVFGAFGNLTLDEGPS